MQAVGNLGKIPKHLHMNYMRVFVYKWKCRHKYSSCAPTMTYIYAILAWLSQCPSLEQCMPPLWVTFCCRFKHANICVITVYTCTAVVKL